jgi:hypothetical protein
MQYQDKLLAYRETQGYSKYQQYLLDFKSGRNSSKQLRPALRRDEVFPPVALPVDRYKSSEPSTCAAQLILPRPAVMTARDTSSNCIANAHTQYSSKERATSELDRQGQIRQSSTVSHLRIDQQDPYFQVPHESCEREKVRDCATIQRPPRPTTRIGKSSYFHTVLLR